MFDFPEAFAPYINPIRSTEMSSRFSARDTCNGNRSLLLAVNKIRVSSLNEYIFSNFADSNISISNLYVNICRKDNKIFYNLLNFTVKSA